MLSFSQDNNRVNMNLRIIPLIGQTYIRKEYFDKEIINETLLTQFKGNLSALGVENVCLNC